MGCVTSRAPLMKASFARLLTLRSPIRAAGRAGEIRRGALKDPGAAAVQKMVRPALVFERELWSLVDRWKERGGGPGTARAALMGLLMRCENEPEISESARGRVHTK